MGLVASVYKILQPPPLKRIAASPEDPPPPPVAAASPRIRLKDGRFLAYAEKGVPKSESKFRIIIVHGFGSSKEMNFPAPQELVDALGIYFLMYDRAGYGESDPNPKRSVKSEALDIQELADQLQIGPRFYLIGVSMGSYPIWSCLHYIPHRLAGAAMVVPVVNYKWPSLPESLIKEDYRRKYLCWGIGLAKHTPGLLHWWLSNIWFPSDSKIDNNSLYFSTRDLEILKISPGFPMLTKSQIRKQAVFESLRSDLLAGFGRWEFDPVDIFDPIHVNIDHEWDHTSPNNTKGSNVHVWQGFEDKVVPYPFMRSVCKKLSWIKYHEVEDAGHFLVHEAKNCNVILRSLLVGEEHCSYYATKKLNSSNNSSSVTAPIQGRVLSGNMMTLPSDMYSAAAKTNLAYSMAPAKMNLAYSMAPAKMNLAYSMAPANHLYHGHQAETKIMDGGQSSSLFSGFDPVQANPSAANNLDLLMVEELLNPICYNNQALPQTVLPAYPSTLQTQYQNNMHSQLCDKTLDEILEQIKKDMMQEEHEQCLNVYDPALALAPAPASVTPNPIGTCICNNVASLMPTDGNAEDTINFEQFLVGLGIVWQAPKKSLSSESNTFTTSPIPCSHNQLIQTQNQQFLPQNHILDFTNNAASDGVIQKPKRKRGSKPDGGGDEAMNRRLRRMIKNRDSAARSRARKLARDLEMEIELRELREENDKLKKMLLEMNADIKKGGKQLRRTKSWL